MREVSTDDFGGLFPVIKWVFEQYKKEVNISMIFCIMPVAPLLKIDLINGYNKFKSLFCSPSCFVSPFSVPVEWALYRDIIE